MYKKEVVKLLIDFEYKPRNSIFQKNIGIKNTACCKNDAAKPFIGFQYKSG
jgi:hypothetical protein